MRIEIVDIIYYVQDDMVFSTELSDRKQIGLKIAILVSSGKRQLD